MYIHIHIYIYMYWALGPREKCPWGIYIYIYMTIYSNLQSYIERYKHMCKFIYLYIHIHIYMARSGLACDATPLKIFANDVPQWLAIFQRQIALSDTISTAFFLMSLTLKQDRSVGQVSSDDLRSTTELGGTAIRKFPSTASVGRHSFYRDGLPRTLLRGCDRGVLAIYSNSRFFKFDSIYNILYRILYKHL